MEMTAVDQLAESAECLLREIRYSATFISARISRVDVEIVFGRYKKKL
jgi:hypothetical protein